ncbi:phospholipase/carboxylesterase family protein [Rhodopirellula maiorica SM1]|uniref:Phospholipase/carboxylesterase family protein n=1 Tax=Rhodopirellula maiorica SM1 TaxID=1265738 RepID=M5RF57_9BACT|nr:phospholipase/carboxylesterase [Rhodopirellula maiorica]EMI17726.1 phospholipase/carboxylesterase family protein [Rhodopirellula maiorica SM1]
MLEPRRTLYGSLDCIVIDGGPSPKVLVVLCHGYGAPGTDLASLAFEWITLLGEDAGDFRFVFPAAPQTLAEMGMPDGRAWWPINMAQLAQHVQSSSFSELHTAVPPGIDEARQSLSESITAMKADMDAPTAPLVLGGFSQGAMLTLDTALRGNIDPPQILILFSGTLVCQSHWTASLSRLEQTRVYQSHGNVDPILPYSSAVALSQWLSEADIETEFHSFRGGHTIDGESIEQTAKWMSHLSHDSDQ